VQFIFLVFFKIILTMFLKFSYSILMLALLGWSSMVSAQNLAWANQVGSTNADAGEEIVVDAAGNVYTTGAFQGTADFDPSAATFMLTSAGSADVFVTKSDASGNFIWAKRFGGTAEDIGLSIALDTDGHIYFTGYFQNTADFDPSAATSNLIAAGGYDIFVSKLDNDGNLIWAKRFGALSNDIAQKIVVDAAGDVYTTGYFQTVVDFDPSAATFNLSSAGGFDAFVLKLSTAGNFVWAKRFGGGGRDEAASIAIDRNNNVYTIGSFESTADFDPSAATFNLVSVNYIDIFISKLDANGNFVWAKSMGGNRYDYGIGIALDANDNIYATGEFQATVDFDPSADTFRLTSNGNTTTGPSNSFILKLDANGNFVWAKKIASSDSNTGYAVAIDANSNIYMTGLFRGLADFDPNSTVFNLTSAGNYDVFILKLDVNGDFIWAQRMGAASVDRGASIALDANDNVHVTGSFQSTVDFDFSSSIFNLTSVGSVDAFILKLSVCNVVSPNFAAVAPICAGATLALPTTSTNSIIGTWSPAANNMVTTTYTFRPNAGQCAYTTTLTVQVNPTTAPTFAAVAPICAGAMLAALPTTSTNSIIGTWSPALNNTATTTYTFTPNANNNCHDTATLAITVNPTADAAVTTNGNTITASQANANYQWLDCNNNNAIIAGANSQDFVATATGSYAVVVSLGDCSDTSICQNMVITALINPELADDIAIYPNPYSQEVYLELANFENSAVEIYSSNGQLLSRLNLVENKTALPIQALSSGMYLVKIKTAAGFTVKKLVKTN
jgi:hypothetical protein